MTPKQGIERRAMLKLIGFGGATLMVSDVLPAFAEETDCGEEPYEGKFVIYATFDGGWDQLLTTDPRDATDPAYGPSQTIDPAYDVIRVSDQGEGSIDATMTLTNGTGLYQPEGSNITVGPAMYTLAREHWQDLCIVRGLDMGTLTHAVGKRYFLTGKFPRGLQANGSSMTTATAAQLTNASPLPNLVVGMESYNEDLPAWSSGMVIANPSDILGVLAPLSEPLSGLTGATVAGYLSEWSCMDHRLNGDGVVTNYYDSALKAEDLTSGCYAEYFNFVNPESGSAVDLALTKFGITARGGAAVSAMAAPSGQAFLAAQAITNGVAQCVSVRMANGIDHHDDDWESDHGPAVREGMDGLAILISHLKETLDHNGAPFWDRTVLVVSSDFARTPKRNSRGGRDHHLSSSCILAGAGIEGNQVIGGTDETYTRELIDPATGAVGGDLVIRPPDVHATILSALGLSYEHLSNQDPTLIPAIIKSSG